MNSEKYFTLGYEQGLKDGKWSRGKIKKKYIDNLYRVETQYLSNREAQKYKMGWQEGFTDAVRSEIQSQVTNEDCLIKHIDKAFNIGC